jgi:hypothetical protein
MTSSGGHLDSLSKRSRRAGVEKRNACGFRKGREKSECVFRGGPAARQNHGRQGGRFSGYACGNARQRLIIALARFGGLRIPSELDGMRWDEMNRERNKIYRRPKARASTARGRSGRYLPKASAALPVGIAS